MQLAFYAWMITNEQSLHTTTTKNKQTNKTQKTQDTKKNIKNVTRGIGITEQQKTGKQGRDDSIKQFTIQHQPTHHFTLI